MIETYTGKTAIGEVHTDGKQDQEPSLWVYHCLSRLIPSEFPGIHNTGFVLQRAAQCDGPLGFGQEDRMRRRVREKRENDDAEGGCDGPQDEEEQLPAIYAWGVDMSDAVSDETS